MTDGSRDGNVPSATLRWLDGPDDWDGQGAAALVLAGADQAARRAALHRLAARVPGLEGPGTAILHRAGRGPILLRDGREIQRPALSSASRGDLAAVAVAPGPVGIDVEIVEGAGPVPWAVLHPDEAAELRALAAAQRAAAFARIWSVKEAYLKALRLGLSRDPAGLRVRFGDRPVRVDDPAATCPFQLIETRWITTASVSAAVSIVILQPVPNRVST